MRRLRPATAGLIAALAMVCLAPVAHAAPPPGPPAWSDEFDGTSLDAQRWAHRATGERHDAILTPDAVSVGDGELTIATYTEAGEHYSGMVSTHQRGTEGFEQRYGYFEARMRFATALGQWSAFWLQSRTIGDPIGDPQTAGVEMDIAEHRRCTGAPRPAPPPPCAAGDDISGRIQQALIWDGYGADSKSAVKLSDPLTGLGNGSWHTYALRWTPTGLTFFYDNVATWSIDGPISRRSQYIILSSEVGEFFAGAIPPEGYGTRAASTTRMQVDYVRVWENPPATVPANTAAPVVSGTPAVGQALACSVGSWTGTPAPSFGYAWLHDGAPIAGATAPAHTVRVADQGHALSCRVTASNTAGIVSAVSSARDVPAATARVLVPSPPPPPPPVVVVPVAPADRTAPLASLSGRRTQRLGPTVTVTIACPDEACRATARGTVRLPRLGRTRARTLATSPRTTTIARGARATIRLTLSRPARAAIKRALDGRRRVVVKLAVTVADSAGNVRRLSRQVVLRR